MVAPVEDRLLAEIGAALDDVEQDALTEAAAPVNNLNNLPTIKYATGLGLPVIEWTSAIKNAGSADIALRASRTFSESARLLLAQVVAGEITEEQFYARLGAEYSRYARNSYVAGRRAMGVLAPMTDEEIEDFDESMLEDLAALDGFMRGPGGAGLGTLIASMILDPTNYLGSGLPGDPWKSWPQPLGAGVKSLKQLTKEYDEVLKKGKVPSDKLLKRIAQQTAREAAKKDVGKFAQTVDRYADNVWAMQHKGEAAALRQFIPEEATLVWWTLGPADHCIDCVRLSDASPFYASVLGGNGISPGTGHTRCGGKCRCSLEWDIPKVVCTDPLAGAGALGDLLVETRTDLHETADGTRLNVWIQEAATCALPASIDSFAGDIAMPDEIGDDYAYDWGEDIAASIRGSVATTTIAWRVLDDAVRTGRAVPGLEAPAGFMDAMMAILDGPWDDINFTRYETAGTVYHAAWRKTPTAIKVEFGGTTSGLAILDQEFTLRAINDIASQAHRLGLGLEINGANANNGMGAFLATLGAGRYLTTPTSPTVVPRFADQQIVWGVHSGPSRPALVTTHTPPSTPIGDMAVIKETQAGAELHLIGGVNPKRILRDQDGVEWLVKDAGPIGEMGVERAMPEAIATQVHETLGNNVAAAGVATYKGQGVTVQKMVPADRLGGIAPHVPSPIDLTPDQQIELMRQWVVDVLTGNNDGHIGNWLVEPDGRLLGVDKGLAFWNMPRYRYGYVDGKPGILPLDQVDVTLGPHIGPLFLRPYTQEGRTGLLALEHVSPQVVDEMLGRVAAWDTEEYLRVVDRLIPGLMAGSKKNVEITPEVWREMFRLQKDELHLAMASAFKNEIERTIRGNHYVPPAWKKWIDDGGEFAGKTPARPLAFSPDLASQDWAARIGTDFGKDAVGFDLLSVEAQKAAYDALVTLRAADPEAFRAFTGFIAEDTEKTIGKGMVIATRAKGEAYGTSFIRLNTQYLGAEPMTTPGGLLVGGWEYGKQTLRKDAASGYFWAGKAPTDADLLMGVIVHEYGHHLDMWHGLTPEVWDAPGAAALNARSKVWRDFWAGHKDDFVSKYGAESWGPAEHHAEAIKAAILGGDEPVAVALRDLLDIPTGTPAAPLHGIGPNGHGLLPEVEALQAYPNMGLVKDAAPSAVFPKLPDVEVGDGVETAFKALEDRFPDEWDTITARNRLMALSAYLRGDEAKYGSHLYILKKGYTDDEIAFQIRQWDEAFRQSATSTTGTVYRGTEDRGWGVGSVVTEKYAFGGTKEAARSYADESGGVILRYDVPIGTSALPIYAPSDPAYHVVFARDIPWVVYGESVDDGVRVLHLRPQAAPAQLPTHGKRLFAAPGGKQWVFKVENPDAEVAAASVMHAVGLRVPPATRMVIDGDTGAMLPWVSGKALADAPMVSGAPIAAAMTSDQMAELARQSVVDFLIGNADTHLANWLIDDAGRLWGIDRNRAFFGLAVAGGTPGAFFKGPVAFNWVMEDPAFWQKVRPDDIGEIIARLDAMSDQQFLDLVGDRAISEIALAGLGYTTDTGAMLAHQKAIFLERKHELRAGWEGFMGNRLAQAIKDNPGKVPNDWRVWLDEGGQFEITRRALEPIQPSAPLSSILPGPSAVVPVVGASTKDGFSLVGTNHATWNAAFIPAKNRLEAVARLESVFPNAQGNILEGFDLPQLNAILARAEHMDGMGVDLSLLAKLGDFSKVPAPDKADAAVYGLTYGNKVALRHTGRWYGSASPTHATVYDDIGGLFAHEYGHVIWHSTGTSGQARLLDLWQQVLDNGNDALLSDYATKSIDEWIGEVVAKITAPDYVPGTVSYDDVFWGALVADGHVKSLASVAVAAVPGPEVPKAFMWPDPKTLVADPQSKALLGSTPKRLMLDTTTGQRYVFAPGEERVRETVLAEFARSLGLQVPEYRYVTLADNSVGIVMPYIEGVPLPDNWWDTVTDKQARDLAQHSIFDYIVGNTDTRRGNFLIDPDGAIWGFDKDRAVRWVTESKTKASDFWGAELSVYDSLFNRAGGRALDRLTPADFEVVFARLAEIPDFDFLQAMQVAVKATRKPDGKPIDMGSALVALAKRKKGVSDEYAAAMRMRIDTAIKKKQDVPPVWLEWRVKGTFGKTTGAVMPPPAVGYTQQPVFHVKPEPEIVLPSSPVGPPKPSEDINAWGPADPQEYILPDSALPLNAPLVEWSGKTVDEPPLPNLGPTPEQRKAAKEARDAVVRTWKDVDSGKVPLAFSWSNWDATEAKKAGLTVEKIGDAYVIAKDPASLNPLRDLAAKGVSTGSDEFWQAMGYSVDDLIAYDAADALGKTFSLRAGVMVVEPDGRVWVLAPRNKFAGYENTIIKGGVDPGETAAAAAVREVREEIGLSVELDAFLGDFLNSDGTAISRMYIGHRTGGGPLWAKVKETYRARLLTADEARKVLTRYGKPDVRDQAVIEATVTALAGKPGAPVFTLPVESLPDFVAKTSPSTPDIPAFKPAPFQPGTAKWGWDVPSWKTGWGGKPRAGVVEQPPASVAYGFDHQQVIGYDGMSVDVPPAPKFPYDQTIYTLPDGSKQPMYWKVESKGPATATAKDPLASIDHGDLSMTAYHAYFTKDTWGPFTGPTGQMTITKVDAANEVRITVITLTDVSDDKKALSMTVGGVLGVVQDGPKVSPISKIVRIEGPAVSSAESASPGFRKAMKALGALDGPDGDLLIADPLAFFALAQTVNAAVPTPNPAALIPPTPGKPTWKTTQEMIDDLTKRYPGADFSELAKLDFESAALAMAQTDYILQRYGVSFVFKGVTVPKTLGPGTYAKVERLDPAVPGSAIFLPEWLWKDKAELAKAAKHSGGTGWFTPTDGTTDAFIQNTLVHELGHEYMGLHLYSRFGQKGDEIRAQVDAWFKEYQTHFNFSTGKVTGMPVVSGYSSRNPHECWSEAFTAAVGQFPMDHPEINKLRGILSAQYPDLILAPVTPTISVTGVKELFWANSKKQVQDPNVRFNLHVAQLRKLAATIKADADIGTLRVNQTLLDQVPKLREMLVAAGADSGEKTLTITRDQLLTLAKTIDSNAPSVPLTGFVPSQATVPEPKFVTGFGQVDLPLVEHALTHITDVSNPKSGADMWKTSFNIDLPSGLSKDVSFIIDMDVCQISIGAAGLTDDEFQALIVASLAVTKATVDTLPASVSKYHIVFTTIPTDPQYIWWGDYAKMVDASGWVQDYGRLSAKNVETVMGMLDADLASHTKIVGFLGPLPSTAAIVPQIKPSVVPAADAATAMSVTDNGVVGVGYNGVMYKAIILHTNAGTTAKLFWRTEGDTLLWEVPGPIVIPGTTPALVATLLRHVEFLADTMEMDPGLKTLLITKKAWSQLPGDLRNWITGTQAAAMWANGDMTINRAALMELRAAIQSAHPPVAQLSVSPYPWGTHPLVHWQAELAGADFGKIVSTFHTQPAVVAGVTKIVGLEYEAGTRAITASAAVGLGDTKTLVLTSMTATAAQPILDRTIAYLAILRSMSDFLSDPTITHVGLTKVATPDAVRGWLLAHGAQSKADVWWMTREQFVAAVAEASVPLPNTVKIASQAIIDPGPGLPAAAHLDDVQPPATQGSTYTTNFVEHTEAATGQYKANKVATYALPSTGSTGAVTWRRNGNDLYVSLVESAPPTGDYTQQMMFEATLLEHVKRMAGYAASNPKVKSFRVSSEVMATIDETALADALLKHGKAYSGGWEVNPHHLVDVLHDYDAAQAFNIGVLAPLIAPSALPDIDDAFDGAAVVEAVAPKTLGEKVLAALDSASPQKVKIELDGYVLNESRYAEQGAVQWRRLGNNLYIHHAMGTSDSGGKTTKEAVLAQIVAFASMMDTYPMIGGFRLLDGVVDDMGLAPATYLHEILHAAGAKVYPGGMKMTAEQVKSLRDELVGAVKVATATPPVTAPKPLTDFAEMLGVTNKTDMETLVFGFGVNTDGSVLLATSKGGVEAHVIGWGEPGSDIAILSKLDIVDVLPTGPVATGALGAGIITPTAEYVHDAQIGVIAGLIDHGAGQDIIINAAVLKAHPDLIEPLKWMGFHYVGENLFLSKKDVSAVAKALAKNDISLVPKSVYAKQKGASNPPYPPVPGITLKPSASIMLGAFEGAPQLSHVVDKESATVIHHWYAVPTQFAPEGKVEVTLSIAGGTGWSGPLKITYVEHGVDEANTDQALGHALLKAIDWVKRNPDLTGIAIRDDCAYSTAQAFISAGATQSNGFFRLTRDQAIALGKALNDLAGHTNAVAVIDAIPKAMPPLATLEVFGTTKALIDDLAKHIDTLSGDVVAMGTDWYAKSFFGDSLYLNYGVPGTAGGPFTMGGSSIQYGPEAQQLTATAVVHLLTTGPVEVWAGTYGLAFNDAFLADFGPLAALLKAYGAVEDGNVPGLLLTKAQAAKFIADLKADMPVPVGQIGGLGDSYATPPAPSLTAQLGFSPSQIDSLKTIDETFDSELPIPGQDGVIVLYDPKTTDSPSFYWTGKGNDEVMVVAAKAGTETMFDIEVYWLVAIPKIINAVEGKGVTTVILGGGLTDNLGDILVAAGATKSGKAYVTTPDVLSKVAHLISEDIASPAPLLGSAATPMPVAPAVDFSSEMGIAVALDQASSMGKVVEIPPYQAGATNSVTLPHGVKGVYDTVHPGDLVIYGVDKDVSEPLAGAVGVAKAKLALLHYVAAKADAEGKGLVIGPFFGHDTVGLSSILKKYGATQSAAQDWTKLPAQDVKALLDDLVAWADQHGVTLPAPVPKPQTAAELADLPKGDWKKGLIAFQTQAPANPATGDAIKVAFGANAYEFTPDGPKYVKLLNNGLVIDVQQVNHPQAGNVLSVVNLAVGTQGTTDYAIHYAVASGIVGVADVAQAAGYDLVIESKVLANYPWLAPILDAAGGSFGAGTYRIQNANLNAWIQSLINDTPLTPIVKGPMPPLPPPPPGALPTAWDNAIKQKMQQPAGQAYAHPLPQPGWSGDANDAAGSLWAVAIETPDGNHGWMLDFKKPPYEGDGNPWVLYHGTSAHPYEIGSQTVGMDLVAALALEAYVGSADLVIKASILNDNQWAWLHPYLVGLAKEPDGSLRIPNQMLSQWQKALYEGTPMAPAVLTSATVISGATVGPVPVGLMAEYGVNMKTLTTMGTPVQTDMAQSFGKLTYIPSGTGESATVKTWASPFTLRWVNYTGNPNISLEVGVNTILNPFRSKVLAEPKIKAVWFDNVDKMPAAWKQMLLDWGAVWHPDTKYNRLMLDRQAFLKLGAALDKAIVSGSMPGAAAVTKPVRTPAGATVTQKIINATLAKGNIDVTKAGAFDLIGPDGVAWAEVQIDVVGSIVYVESIKPYGMAGKIAQGESSQDSAVAALWLVSKEAVPEGKVVWVDQKFYSTYVDGKMPGFGPDSGMYVNIGDVNDPYAVGVALANVENMMAPAVTPGVAPLVSAPAPFSGVNAISNSMLVANPQIEKAMGSSLPNINFGIVGVGSIDNAATSSGTTFVLHHIAWGPVVTDEEKVAAVLALAKAAQDKGKELVLMQDFLTANPAIMASVQPHIGLPSYKGYTVAPTWVQSFAYPSPVAAPPVVAPSATAAQIIAQNPAPPITVKGSSPDYFVVMDGVKPVAMVHYDWSMGGTNAVYIESILKVNSTTGAVDLTSDVDDLEVIAAALYLVAQKAAPANQGVFVSKHVFQSQVQPLVPKGVAWGALTSTPYISLTPNAAGAVQPGDGQAALDMLAGVVGIAAAPPAPVATSLASAAGLDIGLLGSVTAPMNHYGGPHTRRARWTVTEPGTSGYGKISGVLVAYKDLTGDVVIRKFATGDVGTQQAKDTVQWAAFLGMLERTPLHGQKRGFFLPWMNEKKYAWEKDSDVPAWMHAMLQQYGGVSKTVSGGVQGTYLKDVGALIAAMNAVVPSPTAAVVAPSAILPNPLASLSSANDWLGQKGTQIGDFWTGKGAGSYDVPVWSGATLNATVAMAFSGSAFHVNQISVPYGGNAEWFNGLVLTDVSLAAKKFLGVDTVWVSDEVVALLDPKWQPFLTKPLLAAKWKLDYNAVLASLPADVKQKIGLSILPGPAAAVPAPVVAAPTGAFDEALWTGVMTGDPGYKMKLTISGSPQKGTAVADAIGPNWVFGTKTVSTYEFNFSVLPQTHGNGFNAPKVLIVQGGDLGATNDVDNMIAIVAIAVAAKKNGAVISFSQSIHANPAIAKFLPPKKQWAAVPGAYNTDPDDILKHVTGLWQKLGLGSPLPSPVAAAVPSPAAAALPSPAAGSKYGIDLSQAGGTKAGYDAGGKYSKQTNYAIPNSGGSYVSFKWKDLNAYIVVDNVIKGGYSQATANDAAAWFGLLKMIEKANAAGKPLWVIDSVQFPWMKQVMTDAGGYGQATKYGMGTLLNPVAKAKLASILADAVPIMSYTAPSVYVPPPAAAVPPPKPVTPYVPKVKVITPDTSYTDPIAVVNAWQAKVLDDDTATATLKHIGKTGNDDVGLVYINIKFGNAGKYPDLPSTTLASDVAVSPAGVVIPSAPVPKAEPVPVAAIAGATLPHPPTGTDASPAFFFGWHPTQVPNHFAAITDVELPPVVLGTATLPGVPHELSIGNTRVEWSVSPSGKTIGVSKITFDPALSTQERVNVAVAAIQYMATQEIGRGGFMWVRPDVYDQVPGLRNLLLAAGGAEASFPAIAGTAVQITEEQAKALAFAISQNTMTGLKIPTNTLAEYLAYADPILGNAISKGPVSDVGSDIVWKIEGEDAQMVMHDLGLLSKQWVSVSGDAQAALVSTLAEIVRLADRGVTNLRVEAGVWSAVPNLDKFLIGVGASIDGSALVLDAGALSNARVLIANNLLPEVLGGAAPKFRVLDTMVVSLKDGLNAAGGHTVETSGARLKSTFVAQGGFGFTTYTESTGAIFWATLDAPTVGQQRTVAVAQLRSFTHEIARSSNIARLDISVDVVSKRPEMIVVLKKFGAKERPPTAGGPAYWSMERKDVLRLMRKLDEELTDPSAPSTFIGQYVAAIKWPTTEELVLTPKQVGGQNVKSIFTDAAGNEWMFKHGKTGRGAATDKAAAELSYQLGLPTPPVRQYTIEINGQTVTGSLQFMVPMRSMAAAGITSPAQLNDKQTAAMFQHSFLDWVVNNDDAHAGNWMVDAEGRLWAIDRSRAYETLGGSHDVLNTSSNGNDGGVPWLFQFFRDVQRDPTLLGKIKPQDIVAPMRHLRSMSDADFIRIVEPITRATRNPKYRNRPAQMLTDMLKRKHEAVGDYERYIMGEVKRLMDDPVSARNVPSMWSEWVRAGGRFNLDQTPLDIVNDRLQELLAKHLGGKWDYQQAKAKMGASRLERITSMLSSYFNGKSLPGPAYGAEAMKENLLKAGLDAEVVEWEELNEMAMLAIALGGTTGSSEKDNVIRSHFNPDTGLFRIVRTDDRFRGNPADYIEGWSKGKAQYPTLRGGSMGKYVYVASTSGPDGCVLLIEVPASQIWSTYAMGYVLGDEHEVMFHDLRPEQIIAIFNNRSRIGGGSGTMTLSDDMMRKIMAYDGPRFIP